MEQLSGDLHPLTLLAGITGYHSYDKVKSVVADNENLLKLLYRQLSEVGNGSVLHGNHDLSLTCDLKCTGNE
jgi:hypothetical protein